MDRSGASNTAVGSGALKNNANSALNTAVGVEALLSNTFGDDNTATGAGALTFNRTGSGNVAIIADNVSKAGWSWSRVSAVAFLRANDLDC